MDFYVTLHAPGDLDCLATFQLRRNIKARQRIVNPDAILGGIALHRGGVSREGGNNRGGSNEQDENSQAVRHFVSVRIAAGVDQVEAAVVA